MAFCAGSLLLIPLYVLAHPPAGQMARRLRRADDARRQPASWAR